MTGRDATYKQNVIMYKRVFGSPEGKEVLCDLANRFNLLTPIKGTDLERATKEGQRQVILDILFYLQLNINDLDNILKGEF
jgi:hypothetical protein